MSKQNKKHFGWSKTSYMFLSGFLLMLFIVGYVWWPLLDEYLHQFDPDIPAWQQIDWLLIGIFLVMSILIMINANLKKDLPYAIIALAGGYIIEAWGTLSGLWHYYTFETPPLWIIPAWPIAALSVNRLAFFVNHFKKEFSKKWLETIYWIVYGAFFLFLLKFSMKGIAHPLTWFALAFCAFIVTSEKNKSSSLVLFFSGSFLGYFLERWGTTRLCWIYHIGGLPPIITVFSHGMASVAIWRVYQVYIQLLGRSHHRLARSLLPSDENY
jgi:hypothetical protein